MWETTHTVELGPVKTYPFYKKYDTHLINIFYNPCIILEQVGLFILR